MSWNVLGNRKADFNCFFRDLDKQVNWDILLLQEFTGARHTPEYTEDGHRVFAQPPCEGQRRSAIIVHARLARVCDSTSFQSVGRSCCIDFEWEGWKLRCICSHLFPGNCKESFFESITELEWLCAMRPRDHYLVIGVDAQDVLGPASTVEEPSILGDFAEGPRGYKGECFLKTCLEFDLRILNTLSRDPEGTHTCHYYLKRPPRQIDYLVSSLPRRAKPEFE